MKKTFTLIEMVIVVMIISILSGLGLPLYLKARRNTYDKEARAMLKVIRSAEKMKEIETSEYIACSDSANCKYALLLDIPGNSVWDFSVNLNSGLCVKAIGNHGTSDWHFDLDMEEPEPGDSCN